MNVKHLSAALCNINPHLNSFLQHSLSADIHCIVLTNLMQPCKSSHFTYLLADNDVARLAPLTGLISVLMRSRPAKSPNRMEWKVTAPLLLGDRNKLLFSQTRTHHVSAEQTNVRQPTPIMNQLLEPLPPSNRGHVALCITNDTAFKLVTELTVTEYFARHYSRLQLQNGHVPYLRYTAYSSFFLHLYAPRSFMYKIRSSSVTENLQDAVRSYKML